MGKKFAQNKVAVSSVVGIVVMLAITLLSIGIIILYTLPAIDDMEDMAKAQKIEQGFTVFDSRTSKAALGESPLQTTGISLMGGNVEVMGDDDAYNESRIMIIALSFNSSWNNSFYQNHEYWNAWENYENEPDFAGFNASMGKIMYTSGDRVIAYEGGGVWSRYPTGGTVMVSPPEFHFNGETLTLPIMKIKGNTSIAGSTDVDISVKSSNDPEILYPNTKHNSLFSNPIEADKIIIYIQSDFYDGWAEYAETLISTTATLDHVNKTAILELDTMPEMGTFPIAQNFKIAQLNESNPEPIYNFSFYIDVITTDASNFNSVDMWIKATAGTKYLEYSTRKNTMDYVIYKDSLVSEEYETWVDAGYEFTEYEDPANKKHANCTFDLLNKTYLMEYDDKDIEEYSWNVTSPTTMIPNVTINDGAMQSLYNITQHYFKLMAQEGTIDCTWTQKSNKKVEELDSEYTLVYDGGGAIITYLHITSNELEVTVD
ncbi:MAG: type IV pilin N-terminal domain-containing protein [Methanosarcinaceae archaeon]|nr:type IV pilin N-terminal domain-containing protein [Methanosarcinaceae archaeon]